MSLERRSAFPIASPARRTLGDDLITLFGIAAFLIAAHITERILDLASAGRTIQIFPWRRDHTPATNPSTTTNVLWFSTARATRERRPH